MGAVMAEDVEAPRAKKLKTDEEEGGSSNENEQDETISVCILWSWLGCNVGANEPHPNVLYVEIQLWVAMNLLPRFIQLCFVWKNK